MGVTAGSPAGAAGVLVGDVLFELDGHAINSPEDLLDLLVGERVGRQATLRLLRGGTTTDVAVTIGERPGN
jgi:S1-C subfamily serine protease